MVDAILAVNEPSNLLAHTELEVVNVVFKEKLEQIDFSQMLALSKLSIENANNINLENNVELVRLKVTGAESLNVNNNKKLTHLEIYRSSLTEIDLSNNEKLQWLIIKNEDRVEYFNALGSAQADHNIVPFMKFIDKNYHRVECRLNPNRPGK